MRFLRLESELILSSAIFLRSDGINPQEFTDSNEEEDDDLDSDRLECFLADELDEDNDVDDEDDKDDGTVSFGALLGHFKF